MSLILTSTIGTNIRISKSNLCISKVLFETLLSHKLNKPIYHKF